MIQQLLSKGFLDSAIQQLIDYAPRYQFDSRRDGSTETQPIEREELISGLISAKNQLSFPAADSRRGSSKAREVGPEIYLPQSAEVSNLQAAIERFYLEQKPGLIEHVGPSGRRDGDVQSVTGERLWLRDEVRDSRRLFGPFEETDLGWISSVFAMGMRMFRNRHPFVQRPLLGDTPILLPDTDVRIIAVGDWGSGIPRAQQVASIIRSLLDDPQKHTWQKHVIHLGDVYYAGWEFEYKKRFLQYWPVRQDEKDIIGSFTLNGNHDMYSGGHSYYNTALADPRFSRWQGKSSLFYLANNHWQIFGLDTSWDDADLAGDQATWVKGLIDGKRKTILTSHHQYVSAYEKVSDRLVQRISPVLDSGAVKAWLWGHEHLCMTYQQVNLVEFPRCIGHGGVPVYQTHKQDAAIPDPGEWEYRGYNKGTLPLEHWAKFGFAVLDFRHDEIAVQYINEDGGIDHEETIK